MGLLQRYFGKAEATAQVQVPLELINIPLRCRKDLLAPDDDFCDFVRINLGIHGIRSARTFRYLADPDMKYMPDKHFNASRPMVFYGSEGFLMMSYMGKKNAMGLAFILRDRIECLQQSSPEHHMVLAMDGTIDRQHGAYIVHKILRATFSGTSRITGVESLAPTAQLARETLAGLGLCVEQMLSGQRLRAKEALQSARYMGENEVSALMNRLYPAGKLDNSAPSP